MATVDVVTIENKKAGSVELSPVIFEAQVRPHLFHAEVRRQLARRRAGTHSTKNRAGVSGGGAKPWRQKGTGRARAGSTRSPIWAGGGTIFGPQPRSYAYRLPKSARRAALRAALAARHAEGRLLVVDGLSLPAPKTKHMVECLAGLGLGEGRVLVCMARPDEAIARAARNLRQVKVLLVEGLNVYDVLGHAHLVLTRDALLALVERLGGKAA